ncbi:YrhK family protein [Acuticoccus sp. MNP-M23]|uniref:YrhK family protein n=1 Tax=Acuticoccus sp. MNP-M23 TaxID=3072793 RepID=UPI0028162D13|nr:YrhK family protein [Acuticoccus sp. MNP-M23]WMS41044.1 YrhK family protein [Acuticoccus sp. MNP-M23]
MAGVDDTRSGKSDGRLFEPHGTTMPPRQRRLYAAFEIAYTLAEFSAATAFIAGSVLFFYPDLETAGTWMFLIGSVLFALKPTLRLVKELVMVSGGDLTEVARRAKS